MPTRLVILGTKSLKLIIKFVDMILSIERAGVFLSSGLRLCVT